MNEQQYRLLEAGEILRAGDQFETDGEWREVTAVLIGFVVQKSATNFRRPIATELAVVGLPPEPTIADLQADRDLLASECSDLKAQLAGYKAQVERLEKERDEAKARLETEKAEWEVMEKLRSGERWKRKEAESKLDKLTRERDEANALAKETWKVTCQLRAELASLRAEALEKIATDKKEFCYHADLAQAALNPKGANE